jgi:hypothetical protein
VKLEGWRAFLVTPGVGFAARRALPASSLHEHGSSGAKMVRDLARFRVIAKTAEDTALVLAQIGLGPRPPPRPHQALPGQLEFDFAA